MQTTVKFAHHPSVHFNELQKEGQIIDESDIKLKRKQQIP